MSPASDVFEVLMKEPTMALKSTVLVWNGFTIWKVRAILFRQIFQGFHAGDVFSVVEDLARGRGK